MKQVTDVLRGPDYLKEGWQVIRQPGLRRFVIIPLIANLLLFAALIVEHGFGAYIPAAGFA